MSTLAFRRVPEPADANSLWEVTEVQAVQDHQVIGFLRISHVPRARYEARLPDRATRLAQALHLSAMKLPAAPTVKDYQQAVFVGLEHLGSWEHANQASQAVTSLEKGRVAHAQMVERLWAVEHAKVAAFESFHVDRPMIDKVEVVGPHQRRGIGRALYVEAANWVAERGLALHASQIQTVAAKAVWSGLARDGLAQVSAEGRAHLTGPLGEEQVQAAPTRAPRRRRP